MKTRAAWFLVLSLLAIAAPALAQEACSTAGQQEISDPSVPVLSAMQKNIDGLYYGSLYWLKTLEAKNWTCYLTEGSDVWEEQLLEVHAAKRRVRIVWGERVYNGRKTKGGFVARLKGEYENSSRLYLLRAKKVKANEAVVKHFEVLKGDNKQIACAWIHSGKLARADFK